MRQGRLDLEKRAGVKQGAGAKRQHIACQKYRPTLKLTSLSALASLAPRSPCLPAALMSSQRRARV